MKNLYKIQYIILAILFLFCFKKHDNTPIEFGFRAFDSNELTEDNVNNVIVKTDEITLKPGFYTLSFDYHTYLNQVFMICQGDKVINNSGSWLLSQDKHIDYDFYLNNSQPLHIKIKCSNPGAFSLKGVHISKNNNIYKRIFFGTFILFLCFDILYLLYRKHGSKENIRIFFILLIPALLASFPTFLGTTKGAADLTCTLHRIESLYLELKAGHFPCRINSFMLKGCGYPFSIFYGDIFLYPFAIMRMFKYSITEASNACIAFFNIVTVYLAFYSFNKIFEDKNIAVVLSYTYLLTPYRMNGSYTRSSIGEYIAITFYPLIIMSVYKIYKEAENKENLKLYSTTLALGLSCIICTHVLSTIMITFCLLLLALLMITKVLKKNVLTILLLSGAKVALLSAFFIVPFMDYFINVSTLASDPLDIIKIQKFGTTFKYLLDPMQPIYTPGYILLLCPFIGIFLFFKIKEMFYRVSLIISCILLYMVTSYFPWNYLVYRSKLFMFLAQIQFPTRFLGPLSVFLVIVLGYILKQFNQKAIRITLCICSLAIGSLFIRYFETSGATSFVFRDYADLDSISGIGLAEYILEDSVPWAEGYNQLMMDSANTRLYDFKDKGTNLEFSVKKGEDSQPLLPRYAYRYFNLYDKDGNKYILIGGFNQFICFDLPGDYEGKMYLKFQEPVHWRLAELISLISIVIIFYRIFKNKKRTISLLVAK